MARKIGLAVLVLLVALVGLLWVAGRGTFGSRDSEIKDPVASPRPAESEADRRAIQFETAVAQGAPEDGQILFGDLHVHTTISFDAFMLQLPVMGGQGAHPPADACDFARHCAALDFWSINDHASNITAEDWRNTIDMVRQCNARAGDPASPDMVSFLGWEWTQAGRTADEHYGHKNVVLASTDEEFIPTRPIAASAGGVAANPPSVFARGALALQGGRFADMALRWTDLSSMPLCEDAHVFDLPPDCREVAPTPQELFRKLGEWGHDSIVIPHGTTWGIYTPPDASWDKQLVGANHDPKRQTLIEVYSGHGDSEVFRDWNPLEADGSCPPARPDYLPMCQRAGQLIEERCLADGESAEECAERAEIARQNAAAGGVSPHITVPGATGVDWLDAGQCRDCDQASFKYIPRNSAQYIAALGHWETPDAEPRRFRFGFMSSSDIHTARAGTGYKELRGMTDAGNARDDGGADGIVASFLQGESEPPQSHSRTYAEAAATLSGLQLFETERTQSYLYTGGLMAVHAEGRNREAVWTSMKRRQVYGTSGPRILLWFDLLGEDGAVHPMGSELVHTGVPELRVRAVGSFEQKSGCPEETSEILGPERLASLCLNECYHPSDVRRPITRIEVVRIRPQQHPGEDIAGLIDDPWRSFFCDGDPAGCTATFRDEEYGDREALYYARAFEMPIPTVNGDPLGCTRDAQGQCLEVTLCERGEQCLGEDEPRAWSSPIYLDPR